MENLSGGNIGLAQVEAFQSDIVDVSGGGGADAASMDEINAFRSDVFRPESDSSFADKIINDFSGYSEDLAAQKVNFESALGKASETGNPDDILAATKAMGDYQLQVLLATKVASKTSSAIEKLTNLQ